MHNLITGDIFLTFSPVYLVSTVEVLDPMVLSSKVRESDPCGCESPVSVQIPECIRDLFDEPLVIAGGQRQLFVTLGQFSIVRLEICKLKKSLYCQTSQMQNYKNRQMASQTFAVFFAVEQV